MKRVFYRNVRAGDHLELFLVSAISSLLLLRFYLKITGYPQVGGGSLHIAHMLYGGLFMMAAIVLLVSFLGGRVQRFSSLLGGVGFGIFIDELGKFITKDNNYFFRPTIGIIYALFIVLYLVFNFLSQRGRLTKREYELNALIQFEEAILQDLDPTEKQAIRRLLRRADQASQITQELIKLLGRIDTVEAPKPSHLRVLLRSASRQYEKFWRLHQARKLTGLVFVVYAIYFVVSAVVDIFTKYSSPGALLSSHDTYAEVLIIGQLAAAVVAAGFVIVGSVKLLSSRRQAFELFRRALLINILLTEFFIFSRLQFAAFPSFLVSLILIIGLRYALYEETHHQKA